MAWRPGNHDKGWNDPPVFAFQPGSAGQPPSDSSGTTNKRTLLNKRVAFPLAGTPATPSSNAAGTSAGPPPVFPSMSNGTPPVLPPPPSGATALLPPILTGTPPAFFTPTEIMNSEEKTDKINQNMEKLEVSLDCVKSTINNTVETLQDQNPR